MAGYILAALSVDPGIRARASECISDSIIDVLITSPSLIKEKVYGECRANPSVLSTAMVPLCLSTNSLQSNKPKPVPSSPSVPLRFALTSILNNSPIAAWFMPIPVSIIAISMLSSGFFSAETATFPPFGVNFMAFETRFRTSLKHIPIANDFQLHGYVDVKFNFLDLCRFYGQAHTVIHQFIDIQLFWREADGTPLYL